MIAAVQTEHVRHQLGHRKIKCWQFTFLQNTDMFKRVLRVRTMLTFVRYMSLGGVSAGGGATARRHGCQAKGQRSRQHFNSL